MTKDFDDGRKTLRPTRDPVKVAAENRQTPIRASSEPNPFAKYKGALKHFRSRKEINVWVREMRGHAKHSD